MGFGITFVGFPVNPSLRPVLLSSAHLDVKFSQGILVLTLAIASSAFSFPPSAVASPFLSISYNFIISFPLSRNLLSALMSLTILFIVYLNHFYPISMSLMRFGEGRGETAYVLPTVLSPFAL